MTWKIIVRIPVFYRNKIFSCHGGVRVRGDELTWTIREKYLFPDPLSMRLLINMKFLIKG